MFLQASSDAQSRGISAQDSETPQSHPETVLLFILFRKQREGHTSLPTSAQNPCYLFIFYLLLKLFVVAKIEYFSGRAKKKKKV